MLYSPINSVFFYVISAIIKGNSDWLFKEDFMNVLSKLIVFIFFTGSVHAGILIEPYLGYVLKGSGEQAGNPVTEYSHSGPAMGARLGYQMLGLMGGLDYSMRTEFELEEELPGSYFWNDTGSSKRKSKYKSKNMGIFVGYDFPILLRAWVSYYFNTSWEVSTADTVYDVGDEMSGGGYGLGIGYTMLPLVSLNLEFRAFEFDKYKDGPTGTENTYSNKPKMAEIMFSVSVPFNI
jgi:hypothetical protein